MNAPFVLPKRLVIGGRGKSCYLELTRDPETWLAARAAVDPPPPFHGVTLAGTYDPERVLGWAGDCLKKHEVVPGIYLCPTMEALDFLPLDGDQRWLHVTV